MHVHACTHPQGHTHKDTHTRTHTHTHTHRHTHTKRVEMTHGCVAAGSRRPVQSKSPAHGPTALSPSWAFMRRTLYSSRSAFVIFACRCVTRASCTETPSASPGESVCLCLRTPSSPAASSSVSSLECEPRVLACFPRCAPRAALLQAPSASGAPLPLVGFFLTSPGISSSRSPLHVWVWDRERARAGGHEGARAGGRRGG